MIDQLISPCRFEARRGLLGLRSATPYCTTHRRSASECMASATQQLNLQERELVAVLHRMQYLSRELVTARGEAARIQSRARGLVRQAEGFYVLASDQPWAIDARQLRLMRGVGA